MSHLRSLSLALLSALLISALAGAGRASAVSAGAAIAVTGAVEGGGTFAGVVTDAAFAADRGAVALTGQVEGIAILEDGSEVVVDQAITATVSVVTKGGCGPITVRVDALVVSDSDLAINLAPLRLEGAARGSLIGGLVGGVRTDLLCEVEGTLADPTELHELSDLLNELLKHER